MTPTDSLFWPYLSPIFEAEKAKNGVIYIQMSDGNGLDRLVEDTVSENVYPGIFVFRPQYSTKKIEGHLLVSDFNTVFYVWCKEENNEREDQDKAYNQAETIVTSIIQKLHHDSLKYKNYLDFDSIRMEPVMFVGTDAAYGYEVKMRLGLAANNLFC